MTLGELLRAECIQLDAPPVTKEELVRSLVDLLAQAGFVRSAPPVVRALLDRELVMSTGVGGGVALPHALNAAVTEFAVAFARPREPINFAALDGQPVNLVFLVVGQSDRTGLMRLVVGIPKLLSSGELQKRLLKAKSPGDVLRAIHAEEGKQRE
jgi:mannitol/fructose-specific phosphotransferase system IIA component (Ntr-type)